MNISESNDLNKLLEWLLDVPRYDGQLHSDWQARNCAMRLADRAHKALHAGLSGNDVGAKWTLKLPEPVNDREAR